MNTYINFIEFLCDLMVIDLPDIRFKKGTKFYDLFGNPTVPFKLGGTAKATTYVKQRLIKVDLNKINDDGCDIYIVLCHEIRHIFQWDVVNDITGEFKAEVDDKTVFQWQSDYENYRDSRFSDYLNQSIEIDAVAFSYVICRTLFGINVEARCDKVLLSNVIYNLACNYSEDEILSVAKDFNIKPRRILA